MAVMAGVATFKNWQASQSERSTLFKNIWYSILFIPKLNSKTEVHASKRKLYAEKALYICAYINI